METTTENKKIKFNLSIKVFNRILYCIIVFLCLGYFLCMNDISVKGFKLNELKKAKEKIIIDNNDYELEIMSLKSYNSLSKKANDLNLVKVDKINYIDGASLVAVKK